MPFYDFKGKSGGGQVIEGEMEGANSNAVAGQLMERGVTPISIIEKKVQVDVIEMFKDRFDLHSISIEELLMFTRQMSALIKAGIPITRAISGIMESVENPLLIKSLHDMLEQLESGRSLSIACARHPKVFSNLYISMIQVGENTGKLDDSFALMAEYIDRNRRITNNIKTALRYPTTVIIAITIAMGIVNLFVIPKFASFFEANELELPWQTMLLLNTSNFFVNYWMFVGAFLIAVFLGFRHYIHTVKGRYRWHKFIVGAPLIGDIMHRSFMARFARSFSMAYSAGVPIVQAMGVISRSIGNDYISGHVNGMREGIERGESLTRTANQTRMFTPVVMQMFTVGEEAGNLDEMMSFIADFYEEEVDYDVKTLSDKIEPLIYVAIGGMVLVLALGIFVPMWDIAQLSVTMNTLGSHPGAILFRLSVMIIIVAILVVAFFRYTDGTQRKLERQSITQTKRIIDSSLTVVFASYAVKGQLNELNQIEGANPFVFLKEYGLLQSAYRGEVAQENLAELKPGWYYSRVSRSVVYIPRFLDGAEWYSLVLNYDDVNQSGSFESDQDLFRNLQFIKKPRR